MNCRTNIRLVDRDDLNFLIELRNDPDVANNLETYYPLNRARQEAWFAGVTSNHSKEYFIFEVNEGNEWQRAGLARVTEIDFINRSACVGGDIHKQFRGKKLAKKLYGHIFNHVFNKYNLNRAWLQVLSINAIAICLYKSLGFRNEGVLREAIIRNGEKIDYFIMSLLESEFRAK